MNEKLIEKKLREGVKQAGGLALKFVSPAFTGVPDRIVLMPECREKGYYFKNGNMCFVELKSTGKPLSPRQKIVRPLLMKLGFEVLVIDNEEKLSNFLNRLKR